MLAAIESMTGARFVHDQLELAGWDVRIADAQRAKGIAPLACKTDRIDAWVLAELARRDLVPEIWLPDSGGAGRAGAGPFPAAPGHEPHLAEEPRARDPLPARHTRPGRRPLRRRRAALPRSLRAGRAVASNVRRVSYLVDALEEQIDASRPSCAARRRAPLHAAADERPGIGWVLGSTIAAEIGEIERFPRRRSWSATPASARACASRASVDRRGALSKHGPPYLRWALIEAAHNAIRCYPPYRELAERKRARLGRNRGGSVAAITIARKLAEASWRMLTRNRPFAPAGARVPLAA